MAIQIWREAWGAHRALVLAALVFALAAVVTAVLGAVDHRAVTGAPVWNKPFKFFVSSALYSGTFAWYLHHVSRAPRTAWWLGTGVAVALTIELTLIAWQAWRGVPSHFNVGTSRDALVFTIMGVTILALSLLQVVLWGLLLVSRAGGAVVPSACRWGAGLTVLGLAVGGLMVRPTPEQLALLRAGAPSAAGAHTVGAPDGGPGLPLVNWSTSAGDRRVPHFVGLHAMQATPLVALLVRRWPTDAARWAIRLSGTAYLAVVTLLIAQAAQGRPLLHPGPALATMLALVVVAWLATMATLRARIRSPEL